MREFENEKADIIHKYTADEARSLQAYGELPASAKINQTAIDMDMEGKGDQEEDMGFDFEDVSYLSATFRYCIITYISAHYYSDAFPDLTLRQPQQLLMMRSARCSLFCI